MLLLQQMAVLFFLMVLGYCMRKREILSAETAKFLSWLVVHLFGSISIFPEASNVPGRLLRRSWGCAWG